MDNLQQACSYLEGQMTTLWQVVQETGLTADEILASSNIIRAIDERDGIHLPPRYKHDCDDCRYLGQYREYDLYFCPREPTLICRYSSNGPDYKSGLVFALVPDASSHYVEALKRALTVREYQAYITGYVDCYGPKYLTSFNRIMKEVGVE